MLCSTSFAAPTPRQSDAERRKELDRLCKQAAEEVAASRKVIADQETLIANLHAQVDTLKTLSLKSDTLAAQYETQAKLLEAQVADAQKIAAEQKDRIAAADAREQSYRKEIDGLRRSRWRDIGIAVVVTALVAAVIGRGNP